MESRKKYEKNTGKISKKLLEHEEYVKAKNQFNKKMQKAGVDTR